MQWFIELMVRVHNHTYFLLRMPKSSIEIVVIKLNQKNKTPARLERHFDQIQIKRQSGGRKN